MKKALKIASIAHIVVWIVILFALVVQRLIYVTPPDYDAISDIIEKGLFTLFIGIAVFEVLNSVLLSACLRTFFDSYVSKLKVLKNTALWFSVLTNLLPYLSVCLLFAMDFKNVLIVPIIWVICTLVSLVLFIVLKVKMKNIGTAEKVGDASLSLSVKDSSNS